MHPESEFFGWYRSVVVGTIPYRYRLFLLETIILGTSSTAQPHKWRTAVCPMPASAVTSTSDSADGNRMGLL